MKKNRDFFNQFSMSGYNTQPYIPMNNNIDIESRLNNIQEQINNLNERISKLESISTTNNDSNFKNSMYMI